jgi:hypothetical protein
VTWKLQGPSQIINRDEALEVWREGTNIPENVVYVDGKPIKRRGLAFICTCNVQPIQGRDLQLVPELDRVKENYWVFSNNREKFLQVNDRIVRRDLQTNQTEVSYQVQAVENWGSFQQSRIMRIDTGPNETTDSSN